MELNEIAENLIKRLVDEPEAVSVKESRGERTTVLEARVAKTDMGKIIGRKGKTAAALRVILDACSKKHNQRCVFQILDEDEKT